MIYRRANAKYLLRAAFSRSDLARRSACALILVVLANIGNAAPSASEPNARWYAFNESETVFVFVHGIFSDSSACWKSASGTYWPGLVAEDTRFSSPSIYLGGWTTSYQSNIYKIRDAATELRTAMRLARDSNDLPSPLSKKNIVFVAHSTGGLVVREWMVRHPEDFKGRKVGLVLMASPSRGSLWANRLRAIARIANNDMAQELEENSAYIDGLNTQFLELQEKKGIPGLSGVDMFESKFIRTFLGISWASNVVDGETAQTYFGAPRIIPDRDHFGVVKPTSKFDFPHTYLLSYYENVFSKIPPPVSKFWPVGPFNGRSLLQAEVDIDDANDVSSPKLNETWKRALSSMVNRHLSTAVDPGAKTLGFDGAEVLPGVNSNQLDVLTSAGKDLNALAVTSTTVEMDATEARNYVGETTFRVVSVANGTSTLPTIQDRLPGGSGAVTMSQAFNKRWGLYVMLAIGMQCMNGGTVRCDRDELKSMLSKGSRTLGPNETDLAKLFEEQLNGLGGAGP